MDGTLHHHVDPPSHLLYPALALLHIRVPVQCMRLFVSHQATFARPYEGVCVCVAVFPGVRNHTTFICVRTVNRYITIDHKNINF